MIHQYDVDKLNTIKGLPDPPGIKSLESDENNSKENLLGKGFINVKIGTIWLLATDLKQYIQGKHKNMYYDMYLQVQYMLPKVKHEAIWLFKFLKIVHHVVTSTIHAAQRETLVNITNEVSQNDSNLSFGIKAILWFYLAKLN